MCDKFSERNGMNNTDSNTLIAATGLCRHYRVGSEVVPALDSVDFSIRRGEFIALVGPSGSGKSTLLNLVGALDQPTAGEILVDGLSLGRAPEPQRVQHRQRRVGFIFQSFNLLPTLTAVENVETPMMLANVDRKERRPRAMNLLQSVGLTQRAAHKPNQLSGGEKQRVAIARALANKPSLLLADEPTGNLDSRAGEAILDMLCAILRERSLTMILVTHDAQVAARADRTIHLRDGRIQHIETRTAPEDRPIGKDKP
jgi:putative ABC transport system ATP-binding protein